MNFKSVDVADQKKPETPRGTPGPRAQKRPAPGRTGKTPDSAKPKTGGWEAGEWDGSGLANDGASEFNDSEFDARDHYELLEAETEEEAEMPGSHGVGPKPNKRAKEQFADKQAAKAAANNEKKDRDQSTEVKIHAWNDERGSVVDLKAAEWEAVKEDFMAYILMDDELACSIKKDFFNRPAKAVSYGGFRLNSEQAADKMIRVFMGKSFGPVQLKATRRHESDSFIQITVVGNQGWKAMTDKIGEQVVRVNGLKGSFKATDWKDDKGIRGGWFLRIYPDEDLRLSIEQFSTNASELRVGYTKLPFDFVTLRLN